MLSDSARLALSEPNPEPGASYNYDVGGSCTWHDGGKVPSVGTAEVYTCR